MMKKSRLDGFLILQLKPRQQGRLPPPTHPPQLAKSPTLPRVRTHPAWQEFAYTDGTYPDATCKHCGQRLTNCQPSRNLLRHLGSCPHLPEAERTKWRRYGEPAKKQKSKRQRRKKRSATRSPEATQESVMTEVSLSQSQPTTPFAGGITTEEKKRFQSDIARGFYATGLPFRAIEVPRMRQALTILQPDMEKYLPTRKALAGKLLSDEYQREKDELIARLRDEPTLGVVSDGWSSVSKEKVVNYIVVSPLMRPLLWCTRRTGEAEQTSEYVAQEIGSVIDEINLAAGRLAVVSVTTDNAPVMQKAWDILERERQLCCNGCSSHALNLILEEVLSEEKQIGADAEAFYTKRERWSQETRAEEATVSPLAWWTDKCGKAADPSKNYYPLLARLAVMIFTIPTSSASSERSWSIHDFIHTKRRNRLDAKRVEKLVFIYCNAGNKDAKTNIFYQLNEESESEDDDGDDDTAADDSSAGSDDSNASPSYSNSYSYDGSEEHKFES